MDLQFIEIERPSSACLWRPFSLKEAGTGFTYHWWYGRIFRTDSTTIFLRVFENGSEVGRIELKHTTGLGHYANIPKPGTSLLEIVFLEVHYEHRLRGLGTAITKCLQERYPEYQFIAFSEGADQFWETLSWTRHLPNNPEDKRWYRPLYIQAKSM